MSYEWSFCTIYFVEDKTFAIYPLSETTWNEESFKQLEDGKKKIMLKADYDDVPKTVVLMQLGMSEEDLKPGLDFLTAVKSRKKLPIEILLTQLDRVRPRGRQVFPPMNVSSSYIFQKLICISLPIFKCDGSRRQNNRIIIVQK
jgi:hypothetical protein